MRRAVRMHRTVRSRRTVTAATVLALALLPAAAGGAGADTGGPTVNRVVLDPAIGEDSGLALSPQHPGVLWTVNDSGNPPVLFALDATGATAARLTLTVPNTDWEAVAAWRDGTGRALLAAADIGDNLAARSQIQITIVAEPATLRSQTLKPLRRLVLRYPDGAFDAESLLIDPRTQRMYVVTKGFGSRFYAVPASVWPGLPGSAPLDDGVLQPVARTPALLATDGQILPNGDVALRTYASLLLLGPLPVPTGSASSAAAGAGAPGVPELPQLGSIDLPAQSQGEGLAIDPATGAVLLSSEGLRQPVLRIGWPRSWPSPLAVGSPSAGAGPQPAPDPGPAVPVPNRTAGRPSPAGSTGSKGPAGSGGSGGSTPPAVVTPAEPSPGREPLALGRLATLAAGSAAALAALGAASAVLRRRRTRAGG